MRKILIILPNLGCNGTPLYAMNVIKILQENDYEVAVWSYREGILSQRYIEEGIEIEYINPLEVEYSVIAKKVLQYDKVLAFTILTYRMVDICRDLVHTIWYIHEGQNLQDYLINGCTEIFLKHKNVWVVSEYAQQYILEEYGKKTRVIHNYVEDAFSGYSFSKDDKCHFLLLGTMVARKGIHTYIDAFDRLAGNDKERCVLHYAGEQNFVSDYKIEIEKRMQGKVINHGEIIDKEEIIRLYSKIDVVVIPSIDESCSLVALEACMMGKPVIVTNNVGAKYMVTNENGWIINKENAEELSLIFKDIIAGTVCLDAMGQKAREKYEEFATKELYVRKFIEEMICEESNKTFIAKYKGYISHIIKNAYRNKFFMRYKEFEMPRKARIILYGAGKNGHKWKKKLDMEYPKRVVAWVDKYSQQQGVQTVESIVKYKYDYVLITVLNIDRQREIRTDLQGLNIPLNKMIFIRSDIY